MVKTSAPPPGRLQAWAVLAGSSGGVLGGILGGMGNGPDREGGAAEKDCSLVWRYEQSKLIEEITPTYPAIAKAARIQGTVVLAATIGKDGRFGSEGDQRIRRCCSRPHWMPCDAGAIGRPCWMGYLSTWTLQSVLFSL